jgi:hypothetical protein
MRASAPSAARPKGADSNAPSAARPKGADSIAPSAARPKGADSIAPCAVLLFASTLAAATAGAPNAQAYRPFDGTDAHVAAPGRFELELGPLHGYAQAGAHYVITPATVLNLGYLPRCELVVDLQNFVALDPPPGQPRDELVDTDILTKVVLLQGVLQDQGTGPSVAAEVGPLLPNVNAREAFGASLDVIVSERWRGFTMHVNTWLQLARGALAADWFEGVILEGPFDAPVRPVGELFVERDFGARVTTWSALVGAIWRTREDLDLDVGLREARVGADRAAEVRLGFTWTLALWEPKKEGGHARAVARR